MTKTADTMFTMEGISANDCPVGTYVYRLRDTEASSHKFGPCEICGKHASNIFLQCEGLVYKPQRVTHHECYADKFGHKECLLTQRRNKLGDTE